MKRTKLILILTAIILISTQSLPQEIINVEDYNAEILIWWNQKIMELAVEEDGLLTLKGLRTTAMAFVAVHDALNTIIPEYTRYSFKDDDNKYKNTNPYAAALFASYEVAVNQFPNNKDELKGDLSKWLNKINKKTGLESAEQLGKLSASSILNKRMNDKWDGEADYIWHPMSPGVYAEFNEHSGTPEGFIFGSGWAKAEPFMLPSQDYFRSPPPPDIRSVEYTKAFNEVKDSGSFESKTRTSDQTHLAMWWKDFVENSHNRLARQLIAKEKLNLWEAARTFALMNMAIFDAYVSVFENKFFYNHWRPYTAIRWAANDRNSDTEPDIGWNNLHKHTYAFPSYPSAHGCASAAAMFVLANTLGVGNHYKFTMTTSEVDKAGPFSGKIKTDPPTRSFNSFSEAGLEASMSRVYLGIHFRYDSIEGYKLGKQIGEYASKNFLTTYRGKPVN